MTTAIVRSELTPSVWSMIQQIAPFAKDSRLFGVATTPQAVMVMLKGFELGLSLTTSFEHIYIISDKPTLSPRGALALVLNSPEYAGMKIDDQVDSKGQPTACAVWMKRRNGLEYTAKFTMEDARRADLIKPNSGWTKYPANMLRYRALGYAIDIVFPDVIGGLKRADELGADITQDGNVIDTTWTQSPNSGAENGTTGHDAKKSTAAAKNTIHPSIELTALVEEFGAAKVLAASGGTIPATIEEIAAARLKLENTMEEEVSAILQGEPVAA